MQSKQKPRLAILFRFYKDIAVCVNRLQLLKKHNPDAAIYWLYGGTVDETKEFEEALSRYLDDFYTIKETDSFKKWVQWDLYLVEWYKERWHRFDRDSIVITQWDLLAFESFDDAFVGIKKDEIFLPYYSLVDPIVEEKRYWTSKSGLLETSDTDPLKPHLRGNYLSFKKHIKQHYAFEWFVPRTIFTFAVLPMIFFEKYAQVKNLELGFLEYKIATYAQIFGIQRFEKDFGEKWEAPINAYKREISPTYIQAELEKPTWWRIFHPFFQVF